LKKTILTFSLSLIIYSLYGQESLKEINYRKVELELSPGLAGTGLFLIPAIGYGTNRHAVYIAPVVSLSELNSYGIMSWYRFYPNLRLKRTNFNFFYNLLYCQGYNSLLQNTIGYGFELRLLEEFNLSSEFGLGILYNDGIELGGLVKVGLRKRFRK
jgi:hypothetical protein